MDRSSSRHHRIRAWRAEAVRTADQSDSARRQAEALFAGGGAASVAERLRVARQLRRERALGQGCRAGYDLGRHAALVRALAALAKRKAPRD